MNSITIFTPTYNRADLLPRLYQSLVAQTDTLFEWIVIDDGSKDDTEQLVESFITPSNFKIHYHRQANSGKHVAINKGVQEATGAYFLIVDSDDYLRPDAIAVLRQKLQQIEGDQDLAGVAARRAYADGQIVGNNLEEQISNPIDIRFQVGISGDLVEVFRTDVLRQFPFPETPGEKFCPEALVWNRIAQRYKLLYFNEGIYITEYLAGGLTANIVKVRAKSPINTTIYYAELFNLPISLLSKLKANINYWRFRPKADETPALNSIYSIFGRPVGYLLKVRDQKIISQ